MFQYTYSKTDTDGLGYYGCGGVNSEGAYWQDAYNRRGNYGPACFDVRHNFTTGGVFNVPFGKGRKFGAGTSKAMDLILGGWNVNYAICRARRFPGDHIRRNAEHQLRPQPARQRARQPLPGTGGSLDPDGGSLVWRCYRALAFCAAGVNNGTCAYGVPALGEFGNSGVGTERAPGFFNLDSSIGKKFNITERQRIEFRAELFNILNSVSWGPPGRDITTPASLRRDHQPGQLPRNIQFGLKYAF